MQAAERHPSDRRLQNEHLANLLRVSLDQSRAESRTPLAAALRGILEEVHAYKAGVLDRDPLKAEKLALQPFARTALDPTPVDEGQVKTVSGTAQRTPAQVLAKLEDPKLARATRVKLLLEIVPELIETWRPDKESGRSEAGNETAPRSCAGCSRWRTSSVSSGSSSTTAQPSGRRVRGTQDSKASCRRPRLRTTRRTLRKVKSVGSTTRTHAVLPRAMHPRSAVNGNRAAISFVLLGWCWWSCAEEICRRRGLGGCRTIALDRVTLTSRRDGPTGWPDKMTRKDGVVTLEGWKSPFYLLDFAFFRDSVEVFLARISRSAFSSDFTAVLNVGDGPILKLPTLAFSSTCRADFTDASELSSS